MNLSRQLTLDEAVEQARKAAKRGDVARAVQLYEAVLAAHPKHPLARKALRKLQRRRNQASAEPPADLIEPIGALLKSGDVDAALAHVTAALERFPSSLLLANIRAVALQRRGDLESAVRCLNSVLRKKPDFVEARINRGVALRECGRTAEAISDFRTALKTAPDNVLANYNLANALRDTGDVDGAARHYCAAIAQHAEFPSAIRNLALLTSVTSSDDPLLTRTRRLLKDCADDSDRSELGFAVAKMLDDLGDRSASFAALRDANESRRRDLNYDAEDDRVLFEAIRKTFTTLGPVETEANGEPCPVFVVGMPRSGTTLVEQILASHPDVHAVGELEWLNRRLVPLVTSDARRPVAQETWQQLGDDYRAELARLAPDKAVVVDKMPFNFRWVGFIAAALPDARIVHVRRDPRAVCWSLYRHFFPDQGLGFSYSLDDLASYYALYDALMGFWRTACPEATVLDFEYEALTREQELETRRLLAFCGLSWNESCLAFDKTERSVRTASAIQVRRGLYRNSSEAWRNYASDLQPLCQRLAATGLLPPPTTSDLYEAPA